MNRDDTKKVLKVLATAYPRYFANMDKQDKIDQINLYQDMFGSYPVEIVVTALKAYIRANEFPPSIAGLMRQIDLLMPKEDPVELWNVLAAACRRGSTFTQTEFEQLPEPVRVWCGDVNQIRELAQMNSETFNSVVRGQFLKNVKLVIERQKAREMIENGPLAALCDDIKAIGEWHEQKNE